MTYPNIDQTREAPTGGFQLLTTQCCVKVNRISPMLTHGCGFVCACMRVCVCLAFQLCLRCPEPRNGSVYQETGQRDGLSVSGKNFTAHVRLQHWAVLCREKTWSAPVKTRVCVYCKHKKLNESNWQPLFKTRDDDKGFFWGGFLGQIQVFSRTI